MLATLLAQDDPERLSNEWWRERLLDVPLRLAGLIVLAIVVQYLLRKLINRLVARAEQTDHRERVLGSRRAAQVVFGATGGQSERRALRARTLGALAKSVVTATISVLVVIMTMDILGYPIGPLLASAGIAGVALGFGAQNLVKDFLAGVMMLLEDQYGVGDVIDMGEATGVVEAVGLRVTRLRGVDGTVWYVRNGEVIRIGNSSQDWARAVIDIGVGYGEDPTRVRSLLAEIAHDLIGETEWSELVLEEPEVWGVEDLGDNAVVIRLVVKTRPLEQWAVARALRERIKVRFDTEGVEIPFPQRTLWIRDERDTGSPAAPGAEPAGGPSSSTTSPA